MRSSAPPVLVGLILLFLNGPPLAADLCMTPDVLEGFARAKLVFSGKILDVRPAPQVTGSRTALDYVVSFEVEKWWKGAGSQKLSVLWRSSMLECPHFR